MLTLERDFLINRICSGYVDLNGTLYKHPSAKKRYKADLVYQECLTNEFTNDDAIDLLREQGKWTDSLEKEITVDIPEVIELLKIQIYQAYTSNKTLIPSLKDKLKRVKERLLTLLSIKRTFDEYTSEWSAEREKLLYLLRECTKGRHPESLIIPFYESQISDEKFRELARSSEWTGKWTAFKKGIKVFSGNFSTEQEILIKWSSLYENILEQQDCPPDEILEDDDACDGWMIWKRKENLRAKGLDELENRIKNKNAQEVFLPVDRNKPVFEATPEYWEEAKKIATLNSPEAERIKRERFKQIQEKGIIEEYKVVDGRVQAGFRDKQIDLAIMRNNLGKGR